MPYQVANTTLGYLNDYDYTNLGLACSNYAVYGPDRVRALVGGWVGVQLRTRTQRGGFVGLFMRKRSGRGNLWCAHWGSAGARSRGLGDAERCSPRVRACRAARHPAHPHLHTIAAPLF